MTTSWKPGEIIRKKATGDPFLVLHIYKNVCTIIADAKAQGEPLAIVLLERNYAEFAKDRDMKEEQNDWTFDPVPESL